MELMVKGKAGSPANIAVAVDPAFSTTVVLGQGDNAKIFPPSREFQAIGTFPMSIQIFFLFHKRPWGLAIQQEGGSAFSTTSAAQQLNDAILISPDIASITLNFESDE
ncbi:hypothetical protein [Spirosoma foliorum]|uniref:Uncharacterized protein n=1 Tax=Spirosoma foliorum TaxID=2710596 RepID=A0A7G5GS58_9BACT|nr:hypothetical protein [Spirosoma foliorum]QMW01700.1 hypothetical protein H3H32_27680 [Spirosoma foliorum]